MKRSFHGTGVAAGKFKPYWHKPQGRMANVARATPSGGFTGAQMAVTYQFPVCTGLTPPTVWIGELGGNYDLPTLTSWCQSRGFPVPNIKSVSADGSPIVSDPNGADVEVILDICNVIGAVFKMFGTAANIVVVFGANTSSGFNALCAYVAANGKPGDTFTLSWGGPENSFLPADMKSMEGSFSLCSSKGITVCCASGDNGPDDGTGSPVTDYPGCSAFVVDCGATTIVLNPDGSLKSQVPWNSGGGASGGGFSAIITKPGWQGSLVPGSFRGEPDCCAMGDPANGCDTPDGPIGGTSAVAPFMAAYFAGVSALLMAASKPPLGLANVLMYAHQECFTDVTAGGIGTGYPSGPGWDSASGLGSIIGTAFAAVATGGSAPNPNPTPIPNPPPVPSPTQPVGRAAVEAALTGTAATGHLTGAEIRIVRPKIETWMTAQGW